MTEEDSAPRIAEGEILSGRVVARFAYTSRGSAGWGVAGTVGSCAKPVLDEAIGRIEQLNSPNGYESPPDHARDTRLFWARSENGPWRFLLHSVSAGSDASDRPNNCFTDCLIVRADDSADGVDPAAFWGSTTWLKPYGPDEVALTDLAALGHKALQPTANPTQLRVLVDFLSQESRGLGYLNGLMQMVAAVWKHGESAASTWIGIERLPQTESDATAGLGSLQVGKNLLSVLFELLPFDVAWNTTFEIRYAPNTPSEPSTTALRLAPAWHLPRAEDCVLISLETACPQLDTRTCDDCGQAILTWADVLVLCLERLSLMISAEEQSDEAVRLAGLLNEYCGQLRLERVPSDRYPEMFLPANLDGRHRELAALLNGRLFSHNHLAARSYVPNLQSVVEELTAATPDDLTYAVADRQFERHAGEKLPESAECVLQIHRLLGQPPAEAQRYLQQLGPVLKDKAFVQVLNNGGRLRSGVAERVLRSVAILGCSGFKGAHLPQNVDVTLVLWALQHANEQWGAPIRHPELLDRFLESWVSDHGATDDVSHLLSAPTTRHNGSPFPLGYELTRMAMKPENPEFAGLYLELLEEAKRAPGVAALGFDALTRLQRWVRWCAGDEAFVMAEDVHA